MRDFANPKRPIRAIWTLVALGSLAACGEAPPPPSVAELVADPVLLDATIVRCLEQHERTSYEAECINARQAAEQIAAVAEEERQQELEAESARKREALRRAQEAADAADRHAMALAKQREQAEYLGLALPAPAIGEAMPTQAPAEKLSFIDLGGAEPQVTVQDIDVGAVVPASPPEPEPKRSDQLFGASGSPIP